MFSKLANLVLFFRADPLYGVLYGVICLIGTLIFPEPAYKDSEKIIYFKGDQFMHELETKKHIHWIIEFYTTWSPECRHITPVFSKLSERYTLPNLRFGKLDAGREPNFAEKFRINTHPSSRQLPTIAYFKEGEQVTRRPLIGSNKRAIPFVFSEENCILEFGLNNIYEECKKNLGKRYKETTDASKNKDE
uniref:Thioredoxin domain-containing protein n=1 Tax=Acrobeloides nanus TaxID=290746 RepID=A0A914E6B9_9BILA